MKSRVSIITVNFNQQKVSDELLASLEQVTYPDLEIIIVNNGSKEAFKLPDFKSRHKIIVIESKENLGFAGGNNLGLKKATGEYLLLLNNDTEVPPGFLEPLVNRLESSETIGAVCAKLMYFDNPDIIQFAGFTPLNPFTARNSAIGNLEKDLGQYNTARPIPYAHGAALMVKRKVLEKAGLMPEEFFLYYEELDWSEKIKLAGFTIYFEPKSIVFHKVSVSTGRESPFRTFYLTRNRILFCRRNFSRRNLIFFILFFLLISVPKNSLQYLAKGKFAQLMAFYKGIIWNIAPQKIKAV